MMATYCELEEDFIFRHIFLIAKLELLIHI